MDPEVADAIWAAIEPILPTPVMITRSAVTTRASPTGSASGGS
jgi:hypothetical protein